MIPILILILRRLLDGRKCMTLSPRQTTTMFGIASYCNYNSNPMKIINAITEIVHKHSAGFIDPMHISAIYTLEILPNRSITGRGYYKVAESKHLMRFKSTALPISRSHLDIPRLTTSFRTILTVTMRRCSKRCF